MELIFGRRSPFFGQNGLENQFFITMTNYIFLGRVPHPNFRLRAILEIFCDFGSFFGRRSPFFGPNGLENQFFITMTNYIFLGRVYHPNFRLRVILEIFLYLVS